MVAHLLSVKLTDVKLVVRPAGQRRVLNEKRKNVHAFAIGRLRPFSGLSAGAQPASYNPYRQTNFVLVRSDESIFEARSAWLTPQGKLFVEVT